MDHSLAIPHRVAPGLCPVNGVRDLVHWRAGQNWSNEFVHGLGQGGGFAYLRFKSASPPRQVYWGIAGPRQHVYLAELLGAAYTAIEKRSFTFSWRKACEALDAGTPPVLGPLDMFYLPWYPALYRRRHIPIHYLLLVDHDDRSASVLDTGVEGMQTLPLEGLQAAWDVDVPGLGRQNRLAVFDIPAELPSTTALVRRSLADACQNMLHPPVSMLGIPAMEKVAREIAQWPEELGPGVAQACLRQVREYLNSPPDLEGNHLTAGRDLYVKFLQETMTLTGMDLSRALHHFRQSTETIPHIAAAIRRGDLQEAAAHFGHVAQAETKAYTCLDHALEEEQ